MNYSRIDIILKMQETGLVPLFYHANPSVATKLLKAIYDGGARLLEFTHRGVFAQEVFAEISRFAHKNCPGMMLGVGSVTDAATASHYINLGAHFVVTPVLREDIALACNRRKILWSPGCSSLSEIARAEELGCEIVKLFPGATYGPEFIKAIKGPQPWTMIMPTGGVDTSRENLSAWFNAGATCVGIGSSLFTSEILVNGDYDQLKSKVDEVLSIIRSLKKA